MVYKLNLNSFPKGTEIKKRLLTNCRGGEARQIIQWWCYFRDLEIGVEDTFEAALIEFRSEFDRVYGKERAKELFKDE